MTGLAPRFRLPEGVASVDQPIGSADELAAYFRAGAKPEGEQLLGVEYERIPLREDGTAAPYLCGGGPCVAELFEYLAEATDFDKQIVDGHLLGLEGRRSAVHLEPGGQPELALAPKWRARDVAVSLGRWEAMLREGAARTGVHVAAIGLQPVTPIADLSWVPKERYDIMSAHLGARGELAHHMMKGSAGVQLNLDYRSEEDAASLMRAALVASPLVNALCANSPLENGEPNGYLTKRPEIWLATDPERYDLLSWIVDDGFSYERYARWALQASVMFVVRGELWHAVGDKSFERFLEDPGELGPVTWTDWHLHLTTLFPEVRIKQHVEVRGADSCSIDQVAALTALWRGLLYDQEGRDETVALFEGLDARARHDLHVGIGRHGLAFETPAGTARELSRELLLVGERALDRLARRDEEESEAGLLEPLRERAESGRTPAEELLDDWRARGPKALLERV